MDIRSAAEGASQVPLSQNEPDLTSDHVASEPQTRVSAVYRRIKKTARDIEMFNGDSFSIKRYNKQLSKALGYAGSQRYVRTASVKQADKKHGMSFAAVYLSGLQANDPRVIIPK